MAKHTTTYGGQSIQKGGKKVFSNMADLEKYTRQAVRNAQSATIEEMLDKLMDLIDKYVYDTPTSDWYERTGDLKEIWEVTKPYIKGNIVRQTIEPSNVGALTLNADLYQHASKYDFLTPYQLVHIVNEGLGENHSMFGIIEERPFWDEFLKWSNKNYKKIFNKHLRNQGVVR